MLKVGDAYHHDFSFTQDDVIKFAEVSGDNNPLHLDQEYAAKTQFGKPIIHGVLGLSVFSKVLGTIFPGEGTVFMKMETQFKRPMFVGHPYEAIHTVIDVNSNRHIGTVKTEIYDKETGKVCITGQAMLMNTESF